MLRSMPFDIYSFRCFWDRVSWERRTSSVLSITELGTEVFACCFRRASVIVKTSSATINTVGF